MHTLRFDHQSLVSRAMFMFIAVFVPDNNAGMNSDSHEVAIGRTLTSSGRVSGTWISVVSATSGMSAQRDSSSPGHKPSQNSSRRFLV